LEEALKVREELGYKNTNDGELASFIAYSTEFTAGLVCLIDSYDTMASGFKNYICVAIGLLRLGLKPKGLRLDSGNLA
jgi:nicotinate phosphoribosyltransferase